MEGRDKDCIVVPFAVNKGSPFVRTRHLPAADQTKLDCHPDVGESKRRPWLLCGSQTLTA